MSESIAVMMTALFRGRRPQKSQEASPRSRTPAAHPPSPDEDEDDEELRVRSPIRRNSRFYRSMRRSRLAASSEQAQSENSTFVLFSLISLSSPLLGMHEFVCLNKCLRSHSIWGFAGYEIQFSETDSFGVSALPSKCSGSKQWSIVSVCWKHSLLWFVELGSIEIFMLIISSQMCSNKPIQKQLAKL